MIKISLRWLNYEKIFKDVFSDEDYEFLMNNHKDLTDLLLDVLNTDFRTVNLTSRTAIGTIYKNISVYRDLHKADTYLAWIMSEDSYYDNPPVDTVYMDGTKSVIFTGLNNSVVKIFNEGNVYLGEYNIDNSNVVTFTSGLDSEFVDIVKCYNPEGLELRLPSNLKYKAEVIASDSSLGNVIYREYFPHDSCFYRKDDNLGNINLNSNESYVIDFNDSYLIMIM